MRVAFPNRWMALVAAAYVVCSMPGSGQESSSQSSPQPAPAAELPSAPQPHQSSPGGDVGRGAGDIGKGTAVGTGAAAKGVGKGAADVVTLHPVKGAENIGKGGATAGKDIGKGAAKGTGKIAKGAGKGVGKLVHHHRDKPDPDDPARQ